MAEPLNNAEAVIVHRHGNAAADLIERRGWCQGQRVDENGAVCVSAAIVETSHLADPYRIYRMRTFDALFAKTGEPSPYWNDRPERTKEEVVEVLRSLGKE